MPDRRAIEAAVPDLNAQIHVLDKAVAKTGYLAGSDFSFADINVLPILWHIRRFPEGARAIASAASLTQFYNRHSMRPSFQSTIPPA